MKVLFVSDFSLKQNSGGAQISNDIMIKEGLKRGHEIESFNFDSSPISLLSNYDVIISSNLEHISKSHQSHFVFEKILEHPLHVRYEHDSCMYLPNDFRKKLFESSKINFFLSDFHVKFFKEFYGDYFNNVEIVYDPIDTKNFYNKKQQRDKDILYCGLIHPLKGIENLISFANRNPDRDISIYGWSEDKSIQEKLNSIPNINIYEKVSYENISDIYNSHKYIYHNPIVNEPFCRMVAEAMLCGLDFIGDKLKVGSAQEFTNKGLEEFSNQCKKSPELFWTKIENKWQQYQQ